MGMVQNSTTNETLSFSNWRGGKGRFAVSGTMGGATVDLQCRVEQGSDATAFVSVSPDTTVTSAESTEFHLPPETPIQVVISGGTGANIDVGIH